MLRVVCDQHKTQSRGKTWETGPSKRTRGTIWKEASGRRELPDDRPLCSPGLLVRLSPLLHLRPPSLCPQTLCRSSPLRRVHTGGAVSSKTKASKWEGFFLFPLFSPSDWRVTSHHMPSSKHSSPDKSCDPFCLLRGAGPGPGL